MAWFRDQYFESEIEMGNVYAFPCSRTISRGCRPRRLSPPGFDPLRDVGADYADRLADAGVPVEYHNYDDMIHGFFSIISDPVNLDRAHEAHDAAVSDLHAALE